MAEVVHFKNGAGCRFSFEGELPQAVVQGLKDGTLTRVDPPKADKPAPKPRTRKPRAPKPAED
jgi:hypothetical protein